MDSFIIAAIVVFVLALLVLAALVWIIHKAIEPITDFIKWLIKLTDVFGKALPKLTRPQIFNVLVDIILAIAALWFAGILRNTPNYVMITAGIFFLIFVLCLLIAFIGKIGKSSA